MIDSAIASSATSLESFGLRRPNVLIVAEDGSGAAAAGEAAALAGVRPIDRLPWDRAATSLGDHAVVDVLAIEAEGVDSERLDAVLPRVDTLARTIDARVIVALDPAQIDAVASHLFGPGVQLLCAPTLIDRVAAFGLAGSQAMQLNDRVREGESERLRRLNEEVARIAQTLTLLASREDLRPSAERPGLVGDRRPAYGAAPAARSAPIDPQDIRKAIRSRRLREQFFAPALIEDPGWEMLLDLFAAELEDRAVSVSSLCIAAAVAPTTALRWIGKMSEAGLFQRRPDPFDRRRAFMALTDQARVGMEQYCQAVRQAGLAIA